MRKISIASYYSWSTLKLFKWLTTSASTLTPKCPRPFLSFYKFAPNWTRSQHFDKLYQFFWNVTIQIQFRNVRDHIGKENTTISLVDWKLIMFDHEGVKTAKWFEVFQFFFHMSNLKRLSPKKNKVKGHNVHNPNQFMASQNLLYIFLNEFQMWFFLQDLVYLRLISKSLLYYGKSRLQWTPLHKILNRKIIINHFQNWIFDAKTRLQKECIKYINY